MKSTESGTESGAVMVMRGYVVLMTGVKRSCNGYAR